MPLRMADLAPGRGDEVFVEAAAAAAAEGPERDVPIPGIAHGRDDQPVLIGLIILQLFVAFLSLALRVLLQHPCDMGAAGFLHLEIDKFSRNKHSASCVN